MAGMEVVCVAVKIACRERKTMINGPVGFSEILIGSFYI
jgi:hypothetical protein